MGIGVELTAIVVQAFVLLLVKAKLNADNPVRWVKQT
jgi:hypothetical protein